MTSHLCSYAQWRKCYATEICISYIFCGQIYSIRIGWNTFGGENTIRFFYWKLLKYTHSGNSGCKHLNPNIPLIGIHFYCCTVLSHRSLVDYDVNTCDFSQRFFSAHNEFVFVSQILSALPNHDEVGKTPRFISYVSCCTGYKLQNLSQLLVVLAIPCLRCIQPLYTWDHAWCSYPSQKFWEREYPDNMLTLLTCYTAEKLTSRILASTYGSLSWEGTLSMKLSTFLLHWIPGSFDSDRLLYP